MTKAYEPKRNIPAIMAAILLCLTVLSACLLSGLYARFTAEDAENDEARVASFNIEGSGFSQAINFNMTMNPGDVATKSLTVTNKSEVSVRYTVTLVNTTKNLPLCLHDSASLSYLNLDSERSFSYVLAPGGTDALTYGFEFLWPSDVNDGFVERSGMLDNICVTVLATQID